MQRVILYKIYLNEEEGIGEGAQYSIVPWEEVLIGSSIEDDGGKDYVLPDGYALHEHDDHTCICNENGTHCFVQSHNGVPLLIDEDKKMAIILEREKKIQLRREAAGMERVELADMLGIPQEVLYSWENAETEPDMPALRQIASILGCEVFDLT